MKAIQTDQAPAAIGPYSQAVFEESSGLLFCSGQIGLIPETGEFVEGGVEEQFRQVLENVRGLLAAAGFEPGHVIKTTLFLSDMGDFARVNALYAEFFQAPFPARSAVAASGLPKGALVELEVIAKAS